MYSSGTKGKIAQGKYPWARQVKKNKVTSLQRRLKPVEHFLDGGRCLHIQTPVMLLMRKTSSVFHERNQGPAGFTVGPPGADPPLHWGGSLVSGKTRLGEEPGCASLTLWSSERASHLTWRRRKVLYFPLALGPASPTAEGGGCPPSLTPTP